VSEVHVIGAGGHAKVLVATLEAAGHRVVGLYDDREATWGNTVLGRPILGPPASLRGEDVRAVIGVGDNRARARLAEDLRLDWVTIVHPAATVHPSVVLGKGSVVFAGAVIQPDARLGEHVIVNTSASVDHDCVLGSYVHVAPGAHLCGAVKIGEGALFGVGASAIPCVEIGAWSIVGGGAACVRAVPDEVVVMGVPARIVRPARR
jgi:sugar O-acyltransferase (sialic acid O-acetyltransferase NeuD family)